MSFKAALCSACGDDLLANEDSIWSQTCNGHVIGMGDHHVKPNGLGRFVSWVLFPKGASNGAKILGFQKTQFSRISVNPG